MLILVREIHSHMFLSHHSEHTKGNRHLFSQGGGKQTMKPPRFQYCAPAILDEALALLEQQGDEAKVLAGGLELLERLRPPLAIDIHVEGTGTTENAVRGILAPLGYQFEKLGHVLVCSN